MKPLPHTLLYEETTFERNEDCENYSDCLFRAAQRKLKSFTCDGCEEFEPTDDVPKLENFIWKSRHRIYPERAKNTKGDTNLFLKLLTEKMKENGMLVNGKRYKPFVPRRENEINVNK